MPLQHGQWTRERQKQTGDNRDVDVEVIDVVITNIFT